MIKLTQEQFLERAKKIHNNRYLYDKTHYVNIRTKISIICSVHGEYSQSPKSHLEGQNCPECIYSNRRYTQQEFIDKCKIIHENTYDLDSVVFTTVKNDIVVRCHTHGFFKIKARKFLEGQCCNLCVNNLRTKTTSVFLEQANKIHKNIYDYSLVNYTGVGIKTDIICKKHGIFKQSPGDHLSGRGCPNCTGRISKLEKQWLDYVNIPDQTSYRQVKFEINDRYYIVDGYDPDSRTVYEFLGDFWHGNPKVYLGNLINCITKTTFSQLYQNTCNKHEELIKAGYKLVIMWESDWKLFLKEKKEIYENCKNKKRY